MLLYEVYTDRNAFDTHLESSHFRDFSAAVEDWVNDRKVSTYTGIQGPEIE